MSKYNKGRNRFYKHNLGIGKINPSAKIISKLTVKGL